jgi:hypothetical protein
MLWSNSRSRPLNAPAAYIHPCQPIVAKRLQATLDKVYRAYHQAQKENPAIGIELSNLSGNAFENWVSKFLNETGFTDIQGTPATGDQGADFIAKRDGKTIVIQAKRYKGPVGNTAVQEVIAATHYYRGDEGWVITNSTFTRSARSLADRSGVILIDGKMLEEYGRHLDNSRLGKNTGSLIDEILSGVQFSDPEAVPEEFGRSRPVADAVTALVNLGYGQPQAAAAIAAAARNAGEGADTATLIRQGLKELANDHQRA